MPNVADAFGPIIAAALSSSPPVSSAEVAMEQVARGSAPTEAEGRYFDAFQEWWRERTAGLDLEHRVKQCVGLHIAIPSRFDAVEEKVGLTNPKAMKAAYDRFTERAEGETLNAIVANGDAGVRTWMDVVRQYQSWFLRLQGLIAFHQRITRTLLQGIAQRAAASAAKSVNMSPNELKGIADVQVRAIVLENREMWVDGAINGVTAWHMPIADPSTWANDLSITNDVAGGVSAVVTTTASLEAVVVMGSATALNFTGLGIVLVGVGFALASYLESVRAAKEAVEQQRLEDAIKADTRTAFSQVADGITFVQDMLAMVCAADALKADIDLRSAERDTLRRFIWQRMFPAITSPTLVATTAFITAEMDKQLNSRIAGAR